MVITNLNKKIQENANNVSYFKGQLDAYHKFKYHCNINMINICTIGDFKKCTFKNCPMVKKGK